MGPMASPATTLECRAVNLAINITGALVCGLVALLPPYWVARDLWRWLRASR